MPIVAIPLTPPFRLAAFGIVCILGMLAGHHDVHAQTSGSPAPTTDSRRSPSVVTPDHSRRTDTPASANGAVRLSAAHIMAAVRDPAGGISAVRSARPTDDISIVHVNTAVKGAPRTAIKTAASQRLRAIRQLARVIEAQGWLAIKLKSMHVDPTAVIAARHQPSGTLLIVTY